jgi:hypothetical protein
LRCFRAPRGNALLFLLQAASVPALSSDAIAMLAKGAHATVRIADLPPSFPPKTPPAAPPTLASMRPLLKALLIGAGAVGAFWVLVS